MVRSGHNRTYDTQGVTVVPAVVVPVVVQWLWRSGTGTAGQGYDGGNSGEHGT